MISVIRKPVKTTNLCMSETRCNTTTPFYMLMLAQTIWKDNQKLGTVVASKEGAGGGRSLL